MRRLGFAFVENAKVEQHVLPVLRQARCGKHCPQGFGIGVLFSLFRPGIGRNGRPRSRRPDAHQPVAQFLSRDAVDPVVILDLIKDLLLARLAPAFIGDHRTTRCLDLAFALAAIEGFHRLDGIVGLGPDQPAAHHGEQINEPALSQQTVEEGLANPILRGQPPQSRDFVSGIMVDARGWMRVEAVAEEPEQFGK